MSIEGIGASFGEASVPYDRTSSRTNLDKLGIDQFLTLLIAQLEHQDPLNPLDSADFTAQLAQFASVEQLYGMNERLSDIQEALFDRGEQQDLIGLIGRTVKADDNTILINDGELLSGSYGLEGDGDVTVNIYNSDGLKVRTLFFDQQIEGEHDIGWDGKDDSGKMVGNGTYTFDVGTGNAVTLTNVSPSTWIVADAVKFESVTRYNNGECAKSITLAGQDGIILLNEPLKTYLPLTRRE